jgi:hypothetical protein
VDDRLVPAYGAVNTPQAFLLDYARRLRYTGGTDEYLAFSH